MNNDLKIAAKQITFFAIVLTVIQFAVFVIGSLIVKGQTISSVLICQFYVYLIQELIGFTMLFWILFRMIKRTEEARYGTLILTGLTFQVVSYHMYYVFRLTYYYSTHSTYADLNQQMLPDQHLLREIAKHGLNVFPVHYNIQAYLLSGLKGILNWPISFNLYKFLTNPILCSIWTSGIVCLLKGKKPIKLNDETTIDQLT